jgi:hypothetical protein
MPAPFKEGDRVYCVADTKTPATVISCEEYLQDEWTVFVRYDDQTLPCQVGYWPSSCVELQEPDQN